MQPSPAADDVPASAAPPITVAVTEPRVLDHTPSPVPPAAEPTPGEQAGSLDTPTPAPISVSATLTSSLASARQSIRNGDYAAAQSLLAPLASDASLDPRQTATVLYLSARSALAEGNASQALVALDRLSALPVLQAEELSFEPASVLLLRARALTELGRPDDALLDYSAAVATDPALAEAVEPKIAALHLALGDGEAAAAAYRRAADSLVDTEEQRSALAGLLENLAVTYEGLGEPARAAAVYDEILTIARNAPYRTQILYKAGLAFAGAGDERTAVERWSSATVESPESQAAYLALVELVNRDVAVDAYQRGYIDLMAGAWLPAINAYQAYLAQGDAAAQQGAALLGIGQAYLGLNDPAAARPYFDRIINEFPSCDCYGQAWLELARVQVALGDTVAARRTYRTFAREHPSDPLAAEALWRSGLSALAEQNEAEAGLDLLTLVDSFPASARAPQALYAIAMGALETGLPNQAAGALARLVQEYPDYRWDAVAYWLGRVYHAQGKPDAGDEEWQRLVARAPDSYYGILAAQGLRDVLPSGGAMLQHVADVIGPAGVLQGDDGSQAFAEAWLATWIDGGDASLAALPAAVAEDPGWTAGRLLLAADLRTEASAAFNRILAVNREDPRVLYALSMAFEDLGLTNLSIRSTARLLQLAPVQLTEEAPIFLQQRAYPLPYASLIRDAARTHGIPPALYFSLIRQESLFEGEARSSAAAQGLAQIIPDTGQWIADRVGYPDYVNSLLFRPVVNVDFGAYYLAWARDYLDGNLVSALVGYNAGPGNAERWRALSGADDPLYVEVLEYTEPRLYVQAILSNLYHYERLYPTLSSP